MLQRLKQRIADMRTIRHLCEGAERHAHALGDSKPGPEHFLLAALDLPDGLARRAFAAAGADAAQLRAAIAGVHDAALASAGIDPQSVEDDVPPQPSGPYRAKGAMEDVMRDLAALPRAAAEPLTGAHVVAVVARATHGTAARALRALGIDGATLGGAATAVLAKP